MIERHHRAAAAKLRPLASHHQPKVDQWIDGMELPSWATALFADLIRTAQALSDFEHKGSSLAYEKAGKNRVAELEDLALKIRDKMSNGPPWTDVDSAYSEAADLVERVARNEVEDMEALPW